MTYDVVMAMIFQGVGGLGVFLLGMKYMSEGIRLRQLIHAATKNRFVACGLGRSIVLIGPDEEPVSRRHHNVGLAYQKYFTPHWGMHLTGSYKDENETPIIRGFTTTVMYRW